MLTLKFRAKNVRDAVFAASPLRPGGMRRTTGGIYAFGWLPPERGGICGTESADMAKMSIKEYSERWFPVSVAAESRSSRAS